MSLKQRQKQSNDYGNRHMGNIVSCLINDLELCLMTIEINKILLQQLIQTIQLEYWWLRFKIDMEKNKYTAADSRYSSCS